jgi:outer membrane protein
MQSKQWIASTALMLALGSGVAQAQKVAILDMQGAVLATSDGKKAAAGIDAKFSPVKAELDKLQQDITDKQDKLTKGRATMSAQAITDAQAELDSLSTSLKRKNEDAQQDLQEEENKALGGIMPKMQQIINEYAAANQITIVVDSSANPNNLVYAEAAINITPAILAAYEKSLGAASASAPAAAPRVTPPASTAAPKAPATTAPRPPASPNSAPKTATPAK